LIFSAVAFVEPFGQPPFLGWILAASLLLVPSLIMLVLFMSDGLLVRSDNVDCRPVKVMLLPITSTILAAL
jgi:hypothetical protein